MNKHKKVKTRTIEEYNLVMSLREKTSKGPVVLSKLTGISKHTIHDWIYLGKRPKRLRKTKLLPEKAKEISPELAYLLGVIEGDGCLCKSKRRQFRGECFDYLLVLGVTDKDFADYFTHQVKTWSGFSPYSSIRPQSGKGKKPIYFVRLRSKDAYEFLTSFDLNQLKTTSIEAKTMFLRGLYDSEGHVPKVASSGGFVFIGMTNLKVINLARYLLWSLGFNFGRTIETKLESGKIFYKFHISSRKDLTLFREKIGFSIERKQKRLDDLLNNYKRPLLKEQITIANL